MRYFIGRDEGGVVRDKAAFGGDESKADELVASFLAAHPGWTAQEVDQVTFDATVMVIDPIPSRNEAVAALATGVGWDTKLMRAILLVILDEINTIRTLPALAQAPRTVNQMKTAIQNKINAGTAD